MLQKTEGRLGASPGAPLPAPYGADQKLTYTVTEAARALGISRPSMYALIHQEGFPTLKVGGRRLISKELLAEWVREQAGGRKNELPGAANTEQLKQTPESH